MCLIETNASADDVSIIWIDVSAVKRKASASACSIRDAHAQQMMKTEYFAPTSECDARHATVIYRSQKLHVRKTPGEKSDRRRNRVATASPLRNTGDK